MKLENHLKAFFIADKHNKIQMQMIITYMHNNNLLCLICSTTANPTFMPYQLPPTMIFIFLPYRHNLYIITLLSNQCWSHCLFNIKCVTLVGSEIRLIGHHRYKRVFTRIVSLSFTGVFMETIHTCFA